VGVGQGYEAHETVWVKQCGHRRSRWYMSARRVNTGVRTGGAVLKKCKAQVDRKVAWLGGGRCREK